MSIRTLANNATPADLASIIKDDGGAIVQSFLSPAVLERLQGELLPLLESVPNGQDPYFAGTQTRRLSRLFARVDSMVDIALHPLYLGTARLMLQQPVGIWSGGQRVEVAPDIQVGATQAIQIRPGQGVQPLHRDDAVWLWRHPQFGREARLQIMVAVSDFTEENGGTLVIPGSHKWDDERMPQPEEAVPTVMKAGDALFWIGSTYHGGGQNRSNASRTGVTMSYDLSILRQEENHFLSLPIERVKSFPEELQKLFGWSCSSTFLGFVERNGVMCDPLPLLKTAEFKEVGYFD